MVRSRDQNQGWPQAPPWTTLCRFWPQMFGVIPEAAAVEKLVRQVNAWMSGTTPASQTGVLPSIKRSLHRNFTYYDERGAIADKESFLDMVRDNHGTMEPQSFEYRLCYANPAGRGISTLVVELWNEEVHQARRRDMVESQIDDNKPKFNLRNMTFVVITNEEATPEQDKVQVASFAHGPWPMSDPGYRGGNDGSYVEPKRACLDTTLAEFRKGPAVSLQQTPEGLWRHPEGPGRALSLSIKSAVGAVLNDHVISVIVDFSRPFEQWAMDFIMMRDMTCQDWGIGTFEKNRAGFAKFANFYHNKYVHVYYGPPHERDSGIDNRLHYMHVKYDQHTHEALVEGWKNWRAGNITMRPIARHYVMVSHYYSNNTFRRPNRAPYNMTVTLMDTLDGGKFVMRQEIEPSAAIPQQQTEDEPMDGT